jgi:2-phospho-L-lactate guanylyltransferase
VPAKIGPEAKQRLAAVLGPQERALLMERLLARTLAAVAAATPGRVVVVTRDRRAMAIAEESGAAVLGDSGAGPNPAVGAAAEHCATEGAHMIAVIAADLPRLDTLAVRALLDSTAEGTCVIAPDRLGTGTNAIALAAGAFPFSFGPNSYAAHRAAAAQRGWIALPLRTPALAIDVDEPHDLDLVEGLAMAYRTPYNRRSSPPRAPERS